VAGKHRRARGILDGKVGDDVTEERIWKEAEAVEVVEHGDEATRILRGVERGLDLHGAGIVGQRREHLGVLL
jgi:hypothetical protein